MAGNVWILAEQWKGQLSDATHEVMSLGRSVADSLGVELEAVLVGAQVKQLAAGLGAADRVLCVEHPQLAQPAPALCGQALAEAVKERKPQLLLVPLTNVLWDEVGLLPTLLNLPFVHSCVDVKVADGKLEARCVLYGGKMQAAVAVAPPAIVGVLPGSRVAEPAPAGKAPPVESLAVTLPEQPTVRFKQYLEPETGDVDITQQDVLISVGRGIQSQDNVALAEELAKVLGGAVCGSRPVIDQGWLTLSRQVGKSGAIVKPKLYLACGISGAPEHVEGMKNSSLIIAINTDPQAPIFDVAHYGIVGDVVDLLPLLTEELQKTRPGRAA